jgi:hypothetical protein
MRLTAWHASCQLNTVVEAQHVYCTRGPILQLVVINNNFQTPWWAGKHIQMAAVLGAKSIQKGAHELEVFKCKLKGNRFSTCLSNVLVQSLNDVLV